MRFLNSIPYRELKKDLITNKKYGEYEAKETIRKIRKMDRDIKKAFILWYNHGITPQLEIEGFTFQDILQYVTPNQIGAFLFFDYLRKDPLNAKRSVIRTKDRVIISKEDAEKLRKANQVEFPEEAAEDTSDIKSDDNE